eukprot:TRINITY_DN45448_c0_g1_i1.p4 TRINITY_DN45448_c0_g1~~TRINITY_DN45448_c0_g1_i1.p4  ORF type:complete len:102 (+),score=9.00 TRINITY_DN45448_c0_g1_i1:223-528(+)
MRGNLALCYKNGKDILPKELLRELQKYIQGENIYIPKKEERKRWGENNGTRIAIKKRNLDIYNLYKEGTKISTLAQEYSLSEDSIRKIVFKLNNQILNNTE